MAVTSGFFDAVLNQSGTPDRKYSADQFGAIFDGIISDGIFEKYPSTVYNSTDKKWEPFKVTGSDDLSINEIDVIVGPGRAWLNKTWTLIEPNDFETVKLDARNLTNPRLDGIYIKIDKGERKNSIYVCTGETTDSTRPALRPVTNTETVKYHLIATVYVAPGDAVTITENDIITSYVGTADGTPFVESNITDISATTDTILNNLESQFNSYRDEYSDDFKSWFESIKDSIGEMTPDQIIEVAEMVAEAYTTDYLSGGYPFEEDDCLYLSSDKERLPNVIINFGFVSGPLHPNSNANELTVYTEEIQT